MDKVRQAPELEEMISYRVSRLQALLNRQAVSILKEHGLSPTQWRILVMLTSLGDATTAEISRKTGLDKALLSRAVKGMTERSLIKAEASARNRSHLILSLTDAGRCSYEGARPLMQKRHDRLIGSLSASEKEVLLDAFEKLEKILTR